VRQADAAALDVMVDWYAVREGLKEDISDSVLDGPSGAKEGNALRPFGESFVRGITGGMVDRTVTPETIASIVTATGDRQTDAHVEWAFFDNPTRFLVHVRAEGAAEPIRLMMELRNLRWQVRRVWLPGSLLERAGGGS